MWVKVWLAGFCFVFLEEKKLGAGLCWWLAGQKLDQLFKVPAGALAKHPSYVK